MKIIKSVVAAAVLVSSGLGGAVAQTAPCSPIAIQYCQEIYDECIANGLSTNVCARVYAQCIAESCI
ncbi:hypothetical protein [Pseudoxanthomonas putridarboris]|uniref:Cysteine rich repeat-containing protein n=1 Tax=Pseudoxanthomonas putridarboris TaxID=752605 RepID=A0ABU9IXH0_9GAMM